MTVLTLRNDFIHFLRHVTAVITVKTHLPVIWKCKMSNRCISLKNFTVSCVYSSLEPNLTVLTLRNTLILFLCHVTAVIIVKTHSPVTWTYEMSKWCVSLSDCILSCLYRFMEPTLTSPDSCHNNWQRLHFSRAVICVKWKFSRKFVIKQKKAILTFVGHR